MTAFLLFFLFCVCYKNKALDSFQLETNENLEFENCSFSGILTISAKGSANITFLNCFIVNARVCFQLYDSSALQISNTTVINATSDPTMFISGIYAIINITKSTFDQIIGPIINLNGRSQLYLYDSKFNKVGCVNSISLISLNENSEFFGRNSILKSFFCTVSEKKLIFSAIDYASGNFKNCTFDDMGGSFLYTDTSASVLFSHCKLTKFDALNQPYLVSLRSYSRVMVFDSFVSTLRGSWALSEHSNLQISRCILDELFCTSLLSFVVQCVHSSELSISGSRFISQKQLNLKVQCSFLHCTDETKVNILDSTFESLNNVCTSLPCFRAARSSKHTYSNFSVVEKSNFKYAKSTSSLILISIDGEFVLGDSLFLNLNIPIIIHLSQGLLLMDKTNFLNNTVSHSLVTNDEKSSFVTQSSIFDSNKVESDKARSIINSLGHTYFFACVFNGNQARLGGALYHKDNSMLTIWNSNFTNNTASADGGAIFVHVETPKKAYSSVFHECIFESNTAHRGSSVFFNLVKTVQINKERIFRDCIFDNKSIAGSFGALTHANKLKKVHSGETISIQFRSVDVFGNDYKYRDSDSVLVIRVYSSDLKLSGETVAVAFSSITEFKSLQVYGNDGLQSLTISRLQSRNLVDPAVTASTTSLVQILPCDEAKGYILEDSAILGPLYQTCVKKLCFHGCVRGSCSGLGNCTCRPGHEGIACQIRKRFSDYVSWKLKNYTYSIPVRDAILEQVSHLLNSSKLYPIFKSFRQKNGYVIFNFAVSLSSNKNNIDLEVSNAINSPFLNKIMKNLESNREFNKSLEKRVYGFHWPPVSFSSKIIVVHKIKVTPLIPEGFMPLGIITLNFLFLIAMFIYIVRNKQSRIVSSSSFEWILHVFIVLVSGHLWLMTRTLTPSRTSCMFESVLSIFTCLSSLCLILIKMIMLMMIRENPLLARVSHTRDPEVRILNYLLLFLIVFVLCPFHMIMGEFNAESVASMNIPAQISCSCARNPWITGNAPSVMIHSICCFLLFFISVLLMFYAKESRSPSSEPRMLMLVIFNIIVSFAGIAIWHTIVLSQNSVLTSHVFSFTLIFSALCSAQYGLLGYKIIKIISERKDTPKQHQHEFPAKRKNSFIRSSISNSSMGLLSDIDLTSDKSLSRIRFAGAGSVIGSIVPVLLQCLGDPKVKKFSQNSPRRLFCAWRLALVEIAVTYRYLCITIKNRARYFTLPVQIQRIYESFILVLSFKSGAQVLFQTRGRKNMDEWVAVFERKTK